MIEVGKKYDVLCVYCLEKFDNKAINIWLPVFGHAHIDSDFGLTDYHYHLDFRFIPEIVLYYFWCQHEKLQGITVPATGSKKYKSLRCLRKNTIILDSRISKADINGVRFSIFQKKYENKELKCYKCPHNGFDVREGVELQENVFECPGHALAWNIETGKSHKRNIY